MLSAENVPPAAALLDSVDALLLDSVDDDELSELDGAELLLDSLVGADDSLELLGDVLLPQDAMTRLTENNAAAMAVFLPTNIRSPFVIVVTLPYGVRAKRDLGRRCWGSGGS